jgi:hypothetical protein
MKQLLVVLVLTVAYAAASCRYSLTPASGWDAAEQYAQAHGGHLAYIGNKADQDAVWNARQLAGDHAWIGLRRADGNSGWYWSTGQPHVYSHWASGEPNNAGGTEHAGHMYQDGNWNDIPPTNSYVGIMQVCDTPYVAPTVPKRQCTYSKTDSATTWDAAQAWAQARGMNLMTITNANENAIALNLRGGAGLPHVWLGGTRANSDSPFVWVSGVPVVYTNWAPGEPNNAGGGEFGMEMYEDGRWNDISATATPKFGLVEKCKTVFCSDNNGGCPATANCADTDTAVTCTCKSGYSGPGCTDVDECLTNNGGCAAEGGRCTNTLGSRTCSCNKGYLGDGFTCDRLVCVAEPLFLDFVAKHNIEDSAVQLLKASASNYADAPIAYQTNTP